MFRHETNRTIVEEIVHAGQRAILKRFKKIEAWQFDDIIAKMLHSSIAPELLNIDYRGFSYIMPFYPYTLRTYLDAKDGQADRRMLGTKLALGLFNLWEQGFIHRDVHANNIFITEEGQLILGDWEHVHPKPQGIPFERSPDLIGNHSVHAFWDKGCVADINTVLGLNSRFAVNCVKDLLVRLLEHSGGAYWERISKGQVYGDINVPVFHYPGRRNPKGRLNQFGINFTDKTVLDIGCNAGSISFEVLNRHACKVIGLELIHERVVAARSIANFAGLDYKAEFLHHNIDTDPIDFNKYRCDIVCAFAVDHQTQQPETFYKKLYELTGEVLLFESSKQPEYRCWCMKQLENAGFGYVKYVGDSTYSDKKRRPRMCYVAKKK